MPACAASRGDIATASGKHDARRQKPTYMHECISTNQRVRAFRVPRAERDAYTSRAGDDGGARSGGCAAKNVLRRADDVDEDSNVAFDDGSDVMRGVWRTAGRCASSDRGRSAAGDRVSDVSARPMLCAEGSCGTTTDTQIAS